MPEILPSEPVCSGRKYFKLRLRLVWTFLFIAASVCSPLRICAQTHTMLHFGLAEGLPSAEVYHIQQDSKGFLWFATDNGLARFDGFQFKTFGIAEGLLDPVVFETMEDSLKRIWIRTYSGKIGYIENERFIPYRFNDELSKFCEGSFLISLVPTGQGTIYFSAGVRWGSINSAGETSVDTISPKHVFVQTVEKKHITANHHQNELRYATIDGKSYPIELTDLFTNPKYAHSVSRTITWKGNLYFTVNNNIFKSDGKKIERVYRGDHAIIMLSTDSRDNLWVGFMAGGAARFNADDFNNAWTFPELNSTSVTSVLEDHEGGLWMSSLERGIHYFPNLDIHHYPLNSTSKIRSVRTRGNQIFLGEYDGTLSYIDAASKKITVIDKYYRSVLSMIVDEKNNLLVSTEGLHAYNEQNKHTLKLNFGVFRDLTKDTYGNIWAIEPSGIWRYDSEGNFVSEKRKRIPSRNIVAIDSLLAIGSHTGIQVYDHALNLIKSPRQVENFKISSITQLNDSTVLVATIGNSLFIADKGFNHFFHFQFPARNVYAVLILDSSVWFGTEKGILIAPKKSLLERKADFHILTKKSGLPADQVSFLANVGNEVFAFTENEFAVIRIDEKRFINRSPTFYTKKIKINNTTRDYSEELNLAYDQNHIQLAFGFIDFNHQEIQTRYRMDAREPWNYTTERAINLYSLSPGTYNIHLQYSTDRINWKNAPLVSNIHISAPWWRTVWFLLFLLFLILFIIYLFARNRYKNQELKNTYQQRLLRLEIDASERERLRIAQELHDRVGTDLSAMKMIVGQLLQKNGSPQSSAIENNFQEMLKEIKDIIYNLSPPGLERFGLFQTVKNHIEKLNPIAPPVKLSTFGADITNPQLGIAIFRILQELLSNSLKYASAQNITIHINSFPDMVNVVYEDNGKGFQPGPEKIGMGLQNIEARVRSLDGQITFETGTFGVSYSIDIPLIKFTT